MPRPNNAQMVTISSLMAARALARAADPATRLQLESALRQWVIDADPLTIRELAVGVAADFLTFGQLIEQRLGRLQEAGTAVPLGEPGTATYAHTDRRASAQAG